MFEEFLNFIKSGTLPWSQPGSSLVPPSSIADIRANLKLPPFTWEGTAPPAVWDYHCFLNKASPINVDDGVAPTIATADEVQKFIIDYFQYRNAARLALDSSAAQQLAWQLFFKHLENCSFMQDELQKNSGTEAFIDYLTKYLQLFLNTIYKSWDSFVESIHPQKGHKWSTFCENQYKSFNWAIEGRVGRTFILKNPTALSEFISDIQGEEIKIQYSFIAETSKQWSSIQTRALEYAACITLFTYLKDADAAFIKYLVESPEALAVALYRSQEKTQSMLAALGQAEDLVMVDSAHASLLSQVLRGDIPVHYRILTEPDPTVSDLIIASQQTTRILYTQLFVRRRLEAKRKELEEPPSLRMMFLQYAQFPFNYQYVATKIQFLKQLINLINAPDFNLYALHKLPGQCSNCFHRWASGTSETEIVFRQVEQYLYEKYPEESYLLSLVYQCEISTDAARETLLDKYGESINFQHLRMAYLRCDTDTKTQILNFYNAYVICKYQEYKMGLGMYGEEGLQAKIIKHFHDLLFKEGCSNLNIEYEFEKLLIVDRISENCYAGGYIRPIEDINALLSGINPLGPYEALIIPENENPAYLLLPGLSRGDTWNLGEGSNGRVLACQKIFLKGSPGNWMVDPDRLPITAAVKLQNSGTSLIDALKEEWSIRNINKANVHYHQYPNERAVEMPYIIGLNLRQLYDKSKPSIAETWEIIYAVLRDMKKIYLSGNIHCDPNSGNIMKYKHHIELTDFGGVLSIIVAGNAHLITAPDCFPNWLIHELFQHLADYPTSSEYPMFTSKYDLSSMLYALGAVIMDIHKKKNYNGYINKTNLSTGTREFEENYCQFAHSFSFNFPAYADAATKELFDFVRDCLMNNYSESAPNYSLSHLESCIQTARTKLAAPNRPAPLQIAHP